MMLGILDAIDELKNILNVIPADQLVTIAGQRKATALNMAIEALRRAAGYPPNLPCYVTIDKTTLLNKNGFVCLKAWGEIKTEKMSCYISRLKLGALEAVYGREIVTYTERTCYEDSKPLVYGLPVIYGDDDALGDYIYLVAPEHKHK